VGTGRPGTPLIVSHRWGSSHSWLVPVTIEDRLAWRVKARSAAGELRNIMVAPGSVWEQVDLGGANGDRVTQADA